MGLCESYLREAERTCSGDETVMTNVRSLRKDKKKRLDLVEKCIARVEGKLDSSATVIIIHVLLNHWLQTQKVLGRKKNNIATFEIWKLQLAIIRLRDLLVLLRQSGNVFRRLERFEGICHCIFPCLKSVSKPWNFIVFFLVYIILLQHTVFSCRLYLAGSTGVYTNHRQFHWVNINGTSAPPPIRNN